MAAINMISSQIIGNLEFWQKSGPAANAIRRHNLLHFFI